MNEKLWAPEGYPPEVLDTTKVGLVPDLGHEGARCLSH